MKRLLLALVVIVALVVVVGATSLNFQDAGDEDSLAYNGTAGTWVQSATGGNNYIRMSTTGTNSLLMNGAALPTTYAAASYLTGATGAAHPIINLYDTTGKNILMTYSKADGDVYGRYEVNVVGGIAKIYKNGSLLVTSGALSQNPSYIGFGVSGGYGAGTIPWDDFVYGAEENKYVLGNPESNAYILKKDFTTPASSGLYTTADALISSNNMTSTFSKSNLTPLDNDTIVLQNIETGTNYGFRYTRANSQGSVSWALADEIFNSGAPYGRYYVTIPGTGAVSEEIWYLGSGATIAFDKDTYSGQDTATMTYSVLGAYWDTSTYSYTIDVVSGTTGATMQSTAISTSSGTDTYTFTSTDPLGVYYAIVKATKHSDGSAIWMNYDYAELTSYVTITGYVNDAETGLPLSGANVNITQSSIINNLTTIADGNYSATYYLSGMAISINATAPLHYQYLFTFTPLTAKTINLNISLTNLTPTVAGLGIGGVARETAYGRPLDAVSVWVVNTSNSQSYTASTSMTGWYLCDEGASCFLTTERPYDVWGEKAGYSNSANATAVTE